MSLSVWIYATVCEGGYTPTPPTLLHIKIISKRRAKWSHLKRVTFLLCENVTLCRLKHIMGVCAIPHTARGGRRTCFHQKQYVYVQLFPPLPLLKHMKSLNPPNGVLVTAVATYLRPRLRISEKWTVSIRGPVITQTFLQQSAGQRRARTLPSLKERHSNHASIKAWLKEI